MSVMFLEAQTDTSLLFKNIASQNHVILLAKHLDMHNICFCFL